MKRVATFGRTVACIVMLGVCVASSPVLGQDEGPQQKKQQESDGPAPAIAPLPPAEFDPTLAIGGEEVKAVQIDTRLSVGVLIDGKGPYQFIVDSGADTSAIGAELATTLALPLGSPIHVNAMTARTLVNRVKVGTLTVGPTTIHDLELPVLREEDVGGQGIIGIDALTQQRLMMDFDRQIIKVEDARVRQPRLPGEIVIIGKRRRGQLILTQVRTSGQRLDAIIDTGTQVTIGNLALRDRLVQKKRATVKSLELIGVTGEKVQVQLAIVDELQVGPILIRDVPIAFADLPPFKLFGLADEPALLLGTDILENFRRVSLDFKSRKVRFQLRRCTTEGVIVSTNPDGFTRLSAPSDSATCSK